MQKTKFVYHKQYSFCLLTSRNEKKAPTDQSIALVFLLCLKLTPAKNFSPVYDLLVELALMNAFYSM